MRLALAALYLSLAGAANADPAALQALAVGGMEKLSVLDQPLAVPDVAFLDAEGAEVRLADYAGQVLVVNFWATWCAPCREEMPTLAALQEALGGEDFRVVTIATGRNDPVGMEEFLTEVGAGALPRNTDPRQALARAMGVLGLPVTVLIDREGDEVARLIGGADWNGPEAQAVIAALVAG